MASDQDGPGLPFELTYLWSHFVEISGGIAIGGFGPSMVTWSDIGWWSRLMRIALDPWEVGTLVRLSIIRANVLAAEVTKSAPATGKK